MEGEKKVKTACVNCFVFHKGLSPRRPTQLYNPHVSRTRTTSYCSQRRAAGTQGKCLAGVTQVINGRSAKQAARVEVANLEPPSAFHFGSNLSALRGKLTAPLSAGQRQAGTHEDP